MNKIETICIINDDDIFTFIIKKSIIKLAVCQNVITFPNGEEAINFFRNNSNYLPEIILLDINMPVMDGWDFLDEFSTIENYNKTNVYLISVHVSEEDKLKAKNHAGITGILNDPTDSETLYKITGNIIAN